MRCATTLFAILLGIGACGEREATVPQDHAVESQATPEAAAEPADPRLPSDVADPDRVVRGPNEFGPHIETWRRLHPFKFNPSEPYDLTFTWGGMTRHLMACVSSSGSYTYLDEPGGSGVRDITDDERDTLTGLIEQLNIGEFASSYRHTGVRDGAYLEIIVAQGESIAALHMTNTHLLAA